jgi:N-acetyl-alpha-D-muramate 1-phosphate uridylyltransferase
MLFAAGRGERMRPLTDHTPKPLLTVADKALIVWHIERLKAVGILDLVINTAHLGDALVEALGAGEKFGVNIQYSREEHSSLACALETAGGIRYALALLGDKPFLAISADVFTDFPLGHLVAAAKALKEGQAFCVLVPNPEHHPEGDFSINETSGLIEDKTLPHSNFTFSGLAAYHPTLFSHLTSPSIAKLAPVLRAAMAQKQVRGEVHRGDWFDIGTPQRLNDLRAHLAGSR